MTLTYDLDSQDPILFPMVDYVAIHVKIKAGMFLSQYMEHQTPKTKFFPNFYKITQD